MTPFIFLRYLQPTSYFSLRKKNGESAFPVIENLPEVVREQLFVDTNFKSKIAQQYDLSWQALNMGYIGSSKTMTSIGTIPLEDHYRFIRKYFNKAWVVYVLILRLLSFKNPFREIFAFLKTRKAVRSNYLKTPLFYADWKNFKSDLIENNPLVSVIIPTLNRYAYLKDVLKDLQAQTYKNFEVIIVDQSEPFDECFYEEYDLNLKLIRQKEKALWLARNTAVKQSKSDLLLFFDDDSRIEMDWIEKHLKGMDFFKADMSSGVSISEVGARVPEHYSFFRISDQLDTGNVLIKRGVFERLGLFDRQFEKQRMGDGEFGLRAYLEGLLNISNPYAKRLHLKVGSGGLREMGSWDAFRTKKWFAPRPIPSVLYYFRTYFGTKSAKLALIRTVPLSIMPYQFKKNKVMLIIGLFISILLLPIIMFQVLKSWQISKRMIVNGAKIESLS